MNIFTMDLEEIKKSQAVIVNALTEINNTLERINSRIIETEKELSPNSSGCMHRGGLRGVTSWSRSGGVAVRRYP